MSARTPFATSFLRLYRGDGLFRSSLDFAAIGMAVYLFVAPLPLPSLDWLSGAGTAQGGNTIASAGQTLTGSGLTATSGAQTGASIPAGIAQAANPHSVQAITRRKVSREWFKLSDPAIVPMLEKAAVLLEQGLGSSAFAVLNGIGRPDDPNVINLSADAFLEMKEKDAMQRAYEAHLRAAKAGHPLSMEQVGHFLRLGRAGPVDLAAAVNWYEKAVAAGSTSAAVFAGFAYAKGAARPIDYAQAVAYYRQSAAVGEPWGMEYLGEAYLNGRGVPVDATEGRRWIEKAAATHLPLAQLNLARLARSGIGGPRDIDAFVKWAQDAANQGYEPALYELGLFYLEPDDARPADAARAAGYLRQAAVKKNAAAAFAYATLCERGVGVQTNAIQAFVYYSIALRGGEKAAQQRLDAMRTHMSAKDLEAAQKLAAAVAS